MRTGRPDTTVASCNNYVNGRTGIRSSGYVPSCGSPQRHRLLLGLFGARTRLTTSNSMGIYSGCTAPREHTDAGVSRRRVHHRPRPSEDPASSWRFCAMSSVPHRPASEAERARPSQRTRARLRYHRSSARMKECPYSAAFAFGARASRCLAREASVLSSLRLSEVPARSSPSRCPAEENPTEPSSRTRSRVRCPSHTREYAPIPDVKNVPVDDSRLLVSGGVVIGVRVLQCQPWGRGSNAPTGCVVVVPCPLPFGINRGNQVPLVVVVVAGHPVVVDASEHEPVLHRVPGPGTGMIRDVDRDVAMTPGIRMS